MKTILTAIDFSPRSEAALHVAASLAAREGARHIVAHVLEPLQKDSVWIKYIEDVEETTRQVQVAALAKLEETLRKHIGDTLDEETVIARVTQGMTAERIIELGEEEGADLIILGCAGHGAIHSAILGSTANEVVRGSDRPVLVVPHDDRDTEHVFDPHAPILVPLDFSETSLATLEYALTYAKRHDQKLVLLHAIGPAPSSLSIAGYPMSVTPDLVDRMIEAQTSGLQQVVDTLGAASVVQDIVVAAGDPHTLIHKYADAFDVSLICMGTHGRRGLRKLLLGNTAERVLRDSTTPVLVVEGQLTEDSPLHDAISYERIL